MATWRVNVTPKDAASGKEFKEERENFKKFYGESGGKLVFELPASDEKGADALVAKAKAAGHEAAKESYEDPLESSDATADFW